MVEKPCFSYKLSCGAPGVITLPSHGADNLKLVIAEAGALQVLLFPGSGQLAPNCSAGWLSISGSDKLLQEPDSVQVLGTYFNIALTHALVSGSGLFRCWGFSAVLLVLQESTQVGLLRSTDIEVHSKPEST